MSSWGSVTNRVSAAGNRQVRLLIALGVAFVVSVLALSAYELWNGRREALADSELDARNVTAVLTEHMSRVVESVGLILKEITDDPFPQSGSGWATIEGHERLKRYLGAVPMIRSFFVIGTEGQTLADSGTYPPNQINSSDREYFYLLKDMSRPPFYIGRPIKSRYTGNWFVPMSLRIVDDKGEFAGVVAAGVDLTYFQKLFDSIEVGQNGTVAIIHINGDVVVRSPDTPDARGMSVKDHPLFRDYLPKAPAGTFTRPSVIDDVPRLFAYQLVPETPFVVVVGFSLDFALAGWYANLGTYITAGTAFCLLICLLIFHLVRNQIRKDELAAEALRGTRRFQSVFNGSADGLIAMDRNGQVLTMNPAAARMFGCDLGKVAGMAISRLIPALRLAKKDDGQHSLQPGNAPTASDGPRGGRELEGRSLDGRNFPLDVTVNEFVEDGAPIYIGAVRDLSEHHRAAAALHEVQERFRLLAESVNIVPYTFQFGVSGKLDYVGPQAERMFGYPMRDWLLPRFWANHVHPDDLDATLRQERRMAPTGESYELEYRLRTADGRAVWIRDIVRVVTLPSGRKLGVGAFVDISDIKQRDQKLAQAQKMEALGQLTGGIAHDFNNLLTVIIGNAESLVENAGPNDRLRQAAELTHGAAQRSADLVRRLLAFARQQALQPAEVNVNRLVASMQPLFKSSLGANIEIRTVLAPDLWPALIDSSQLEAALLNLAVNARDAMPEGGELLIETMNATLDQDYISGAPELASGPYVLIAVSDTGAGMKPEVLAHAFEPFFTTKEVGKGTGLGLSMVFGFARQSGGHARIYSEAGHGTTVKLYLPRAAAAPASDGPDARAGTQLPRGHERVLVVEDDPMVRDFVVSQLTSLGYAVTNVQNGAEALKILSSGTEVDLLFSDVVMPGGMHGGELVRRARLLRPHLKVLLTSGYAENAIASYTDIAGIEVLGKPYGRERLARAIREALDDGQER
jgi:PAS domain S-box-containing protein